MSHYESIPDTCPKHLRIVLGAELPKPSNNRPERLGPGDTNEDTVTVYICALDMNISPFVLMLAMERAGYRTKKDDKYPERLFRSVYDDFSAKNSVITATQLCVDLGVKSDKLKDLTDKGVLRVAGKVSHATLYYTDDIEKAKYIILVEREQAKEALKEARAERAKHNKIHKKPGKPGSRQKPYYGGEFGSFS